MANNTEERTVDFAALFTERKIHQLFESLNKFVDPDKYLNKIGGRKKLKPLMHDDAIYGAFETRYDAVLGLKRTFHGEDEGVIDFIKQAIGEKCLDEIVKGSLYALPYGYNVTELIYVQDGSNLLIQEALNKPIEYYSLDKKGVVHEKVDLINNIEGPYAKYVLSRHRPTYDGPYGEAILSRLYYAHTFRCHGWDFYVKFLEKFGHPLIYGKLDAKPADPVTGMTNLEQFANHLDSANRPTAIVTGQDGDLKVFPPPATGSQFKDFVEAINKRIQIVILGQTLTSDNTSGGSNALGQVHNLVREDKRRADIRMAEQAVNKTIEYLGFLNDINPDSLPKFHLEDEKSLALERANRDQVLFNMGIKFTPKYISESYDLEEEDFEVVDKELNESLGFSAENKSHAFHECLDYTFADRERMSPKQKALFDLQSEAIESAGEPIPTEELESIIRGAKSKKDLEEKLALLIGRENNKYQDILTDALFQARVEGYVNAEETKKA